MHAMTMEDIGSCDPPENAKHTAASSHSPPAEALPPSFVDCRVVPGGIGLRNFLLIVIPQMCGIGLMIAVWAIVSMKGGIPSPGQTWVEALKIFSNPFYKNGPNDQGIGWNILSSLRRMAIGFGTAALIGIPLGLITGRCTFMRRMLDPVISLLRPVSPLAWLPIGLLVFHRAEPASILTIFICSIWPLVAGTAQGLQRVPQKYLNVARMLNLGKWQIVTKIIIPAVLPYMFNGIRLSIGMAWLVIVAAEMLTGGNIGIGIWVWNAWKSLNVEHVVIGVFVIGIVGLLLDQSLLLIARRFSHEIS